MRTTLLTLAAMGLATAANAQLLNYGFEPGEDLTPCRIDTTNWKNFEDGSTLNFAHLEPFEGLQALNVTTTASANRWERVVAFKGLPIEPQKMYRVSFMAKGDAPINVGILEGDWNRDIALKLGAKGSATDQIFDKNIGADWTKVSQLIWSPSYEAMQDFYSESHGDELLKEYFLRLSFTGIGAFTVDNVCVEEVSVNAVVFNGDHLMIDFGWDTNGKEIADGVTKLFDTDCVKLTKDGEEIEVESVEIQKDGKLYIFISEDDWLEEENEVSLSFTNSIGLKYVGNNAPFAYEGGERAVFSFENVACTYDENFEASSFLYSEPEFVKSNPEDSSFELDLNISTFAFTYDKALVADGAKASIEGGNVVESLNVAVSEEDDHTLILTRAAATDLPKGEYTIKVQGVTSTMGTERNQTDQITIELGKVKVAETTYTQIEGVGITQTNDNNIPEGWSLRIAKEEGEDDVRYHLEDGGSYSGTSRGFAYNNSTVPEALYMRDWEGAITAVYGDQENYPLTLPAGDVELRFFSAGWGAGGQNLLYTLEEVATGEIVVELAAQVSAVDGAKSKNNVEFQKDVARVKLNGGNYIFRAKLTGGNEVLVGGLNAYTYTETEGEISENQVHLHETFATTDDNIVPAEETGWMMYDAGNLLAYGSNGSGASSRVFATAFTNLAKAYYCRQMGGDGYYAIYGNNDAKTLTLPEGKAQFTYYSAGWKVSGVNMTFQLLDADDNVVLDKTEPVEPHMNGSKSQTGNAQKTQYTYYVPKTGNYKIKFIFNGEAMVGNIKIETVGSMAVQYKNLLKDAVAQAQEELNVALENDDYAGETRDALQQLIADCQDPDFHTAREYTEAIAKLEELQKAMQARRQNINEYASALNSIQTAVDNATGTRFEKIDLYTASVELLNSYANVDPKTLGDQELAETVASIKINGAQLKYMVEDIIPNLLTKQIANLAAKIVSLDENAQDAEVVLAAGEAVEDDQELVKGLKLTLTGKMYELIGQGVDLFNDFDPEYEITTPKEVELPMIQNPMFYTTVVTTSPNYEGNKESFPGWNIDIQACNVMAEFGWVANSSCYPKFTAEHPISDAVVATTWGDCDITVDQVLSELPVGKYNFVLATMDRSYVNKNDEGQWVATSGETTSCIFTEQEGAERVEQIFNIENIGEYYGQTDCYMNDVNVLPGENLTGTVKFGAHMTTHGGTFASIDNAKLIMTGAAEGFDYAAAAVKVLEEAAQGIQLQERDDQPAQSLFFDLNGRQISAANGVCIRIDRFADGYTVVRKVVVK